MSAEQLTDTHREQLQASAIAAEIIAERGYRSIRPGGSHDVKELVGAAFSERLLRTVLHAGALAFPIYRLGESTPYKGVLRPDLPHTNAEGKPVKYEWPKHTPNVLDTLPRYREALANPALPLCLIEGVKKTDSVASAYGSRVVPVTLNGVFGWRTRNEAGGKTSLVDFELIAWEGRTVWLFPDGDVSFNKQVQQARLLEQCDVGSWPVNAFGYLANHAILLINSNLHLVCVLLFLAAKETVSGFVVAWTLHALFKGGDDNC